MRRLDYLKDIKGEDWRGFRRVARRYERELKRIQFATALDACRLRQIAEEAITPKPKSK